MNTLEGWFSLIGVQTDQPAWQAVEERFGFNTDGVQLIHGLGRVHIKPAGVHALLFKPARGVTGPLQICGFQFCARGRRGSAAYSGDLPQGLRFGDSRQSVQARLGVSAEAAASNTASWTVGDRRLVVAFEPDDQGIRDVTWIVPLEAITRVWRQDHVRPA